jgi:putative chitinase
LKDTRAFFTALRTGLLGPVLTPSEVGGVNALLVAAKGWPVSWAAYLLATAYTETWHTMQPIKEVGGPAYFMRQYDPHGQRPDVAHVLGNTEPGDGAKYAGRGYVQVTGRSNYARATRELGIDFVGHPDLMLDPGHAADVARLGMGEGWFTGRKLADYLPVAGDGDFNHFAFARRIINGTDRAVEIANNALGFQTALAKGGW